MEDKTDEESSNSFHEVQCLINKKSLVFIGIITAALAAGAWAWWKDPFAMSLLLLMTAALVIVVVVLLLIRLSISAGKEGIQIFMGPFTDKPRNISWHEIKSLGIMDIHATATLRISILT